MPILVTTVVMPTDSNDRAGTSRRSYLKLATAVAASAGVVGTATAGSLDDEYGTVVDVTEAGADPDGNESITPIIEELEGDDTLLKFPPGRYYVDQRIRVTDREHFGMVGDDATLVPATYDEYDDLGDWNYKLFRLGVDYAPMTDLRVENFTVDMSAANTGVRALDVVVAGGEDTERTALHVAVVVAAHPLDAPRREQLVHIPAGAPSDLYCGTPGV